VDIISYVRVMSCSCLFGTVWKVSVCFIIMFGTYTPTFNDCVKQAGVFIFNWLSIFIIYVAAFIISQLFQL
jgi:hypothetical protein